MHITKPDDALILLGYHSRGGQPTLTVTVGYVAQLDDTLLDEKTVWGWLPTRFPDEPFDVASKKARGTFAVAGTAWAPRGEAVSAMAIRARVGTLEKTLHVHGDRQWHHGLSGWQPTPAVPFTQMPVTLGRAFGGADWPENPHGRGWHPAGAVAQGDALPNIELPDAPILQHDDTPAPATFSPLPQTAPSRLRWLGRFDAAWERERFPALPDDTNPRWFDGVAPDQCRDGYWRGDEPWQASGMHPEHADIGGTLPGLRPRLLVQRHNLDFGVHRPATDDDPVTEATLALDTVWLFPEEARVAVLYRADIAVTREDAADIAALGLFTEKLAQPAQPAAYWDAEWRKQRATKAPGLVRDDMLAAEQAEVAKAQAETQAAAEQWADKLWAGMLQSQQAALREAEQGLGQLRQQMGHIPPFSAASVAAPVRPALVNAPTAPLPADFTAQLEQHLQGAMAAARQEGEQALRGVVNEVSANTGQTAGGMMAHALAQVGSLQPARTVHDEVSRLSLPPEVRVDALKKAENLQNAMASLDAQIAELNQKLRAAGLDTKLDDEVQKSLQGDDGPRLVLDREALLARHARAEPLTDLALDGLDLHGLDFSRADFSRSRLSGCNLEGATLQGCRFIGTQFVQATLDGAQLAEADFSRAILDTCGLRQMQAPRAVWSDARLVSCDASGAMLEASVLDRLQAGDSRFVGARLSQSRGAKASWAACDFTNAVFDDIAFTRSLFDGCVFDATRFVRARLDTANFAATRGIRPDFTDAVLHGLRLDTACSLHEANFSRADMRDASLQDSTLVSACLNEAVLERALVRHCDLSGSDGWRLRARNAQFHDSRLMRISWRAANLMECSFAQSVLTDADLSGANLHAADTRTAQVSRVQVQGALLTRCRLLEEHALG